MEGEIFDVKNFIDEFKKKNEGSGGFGMGSASKELGPGGGKSRTFEMTEVMTDKIETVTKKIVTMKDEYSPKDFAYDHMKKFYREEITGIFLNFLIKKKVQV